MASGSVLSPKVWWRSHPCILSGYWAVGIAFNLPPESLSCMQRTCSWVVWHNWRWDWGTETGTLLPDFAKEGWHFCSCLLMINSNTSMSGNPNVRHVCIVTWRSGKPIACICLRLSKASHMCHRELSACYRTHSYRSVPIHSLLSAFVRMCDISLCRGSCCTSACLGHRLTSRVFFTRSPPYFPREPLLLNLKPIDVDRSDGWQVTRMHLSPLP